MDTKKKGPFVLLLLLVIVIVFVLGLRYGQSVEKVNKKIDAYISLMPQLTVSPAIIPTIGFQSFILKECGVSLLLPSGFAPLNNESTTEATFNNGNLQQIQIYCTKPAIVDTLFSFVTEKTATAEVKMVNQTVISHTTNDQISFILKNPGTGKKVFMNIPVNLLPLFQQSVAWK